MYYHLRFTPYDLSDANITNFCDKYTRYIVAHESKSKSGDACEPHYHIWIDADYSLATVRAHFLEKLGIPKSGMGKNNKYYMLKEWNDDVKYICKQGDIRACKGFDKEALRVPPEACQIADEQGPSLSVQAGGKVQGSPLGTHKGEKVEEINSKMNSKKHLNFWAEIVFESMHYERKTGKKVEIEEGLKIITKVYFSKGLPLPHPGDRKRWATSLQMYSKMKWTYTESEEHDKIIEDEALYFQANEMGSNRTV